MITSKVSTIFSLSQGDTFTQIMAVAFDSMTLENDIDNNLETERRELFRWISEVPYKDHHQLIGKDFLPKSGQWLLQKETFIEWRNARSSSVFWLLGIRMFSRLGEWKMKLITYTAGSGKSRLAYVPH